MQTVHLIIGAPGSGKTWVCEQLKDRFCYVPHDDYAVPAYGQALLEASRHATQAILAEAPFRASLIVDELKRSGVKVVQHYLVERPDVVAHRYEMREGKPIPKQHLATLARYTQRAHNPATAKQLLERLSAY